jgi:hypothetical protein
MVYSLWVHAYYVYSFYFRGFCLILIILLIINLSLADNAVDLSTLASENGFKLSADLELIIIQAAEEYHVETSHLIAVGIIESGLGKNIKSTKNKNGTLDHGIFQINDINRSFCKDLDLQDRKQNTQCAAKLVARLKPKNLKDLAKYHSKTLKHKEKYYLKLIKVFEKQTDKYIVTSN